jgi:ERCC4-type nuclease
MTLGGEIFYAIPGHECVLSAMAADKEFLLDGRAGIRMINRPAQPEMNSYKLHLRQVVEGEDKGRCRRLIIDFKTRFQNIFGKSERRKGEEGKGKERRRRLNVYFWTLIKNVQGKSSREETESGAGG